MNSTGSRQAAIVLVVEDEPLQRMTLADAIGEAGFEVLEAWDAESAVAILEARTDVRLIVTDIEMPGAMNGVGLAAAVRDRWPPIEIIVVSAGDPPGSNELPERVPFVPKPIIMDRLLTKLRHMAS